MACFATPCGLRYAAHCFNRAHAQQRGPALIPAGGKLGVTSCAAAAALALCLPSVAHADENLLGYNAGAETLPTGITYRVASNWYLGAETQYATEFETEVGQERWSLFAGPTIHYGGKKIWATLTWFPQLAGGGERYPGQTGNLHLIEKTKDEFRLKLGYNF